MQGGAAHPLPKKEGSKVSVLFRHSHRVSDRSVRLTRPKARVTHLHSSHSLAVGLI